MTFKGKIKKNMIDMISEEKGRNLQDSGGNQKLHMVQWLG